MCAQFDVFISYSSNDRAIIGKIVDDLTEAGMTVWWDEARMLPAARIREAINEGIRNSSVVLIFISSRSLRSRWVLNELDAEMLREIHERRSFVIPVLIGRINSESLPDDLRGKKYIDLRHNFQKRYTVLRTYLIAAVRALAYPAPEETENEYAVGDELARFFIDYQYTGRHGAEISKNYAMFAADILDALAEAGRDPDSEDEEFTEAMQNYIDRYGRYGATKMIEFHLDINHIDLTDGFTEEELMDVLREVSWTFLMFVVQDYLKGQMTAGIDSEGKFYYRTPR
jgi:hypothetical protein